MMKKQAVLTMCFLAILLFAATSHAAVDMRIIRSLPLEGAPIDVAITDDGQTTYVLNDRGLVLIYGADGNLMDKVAVGEAVDGIEPLPGGQGLILRSSKDKTVKFVLLDFTYDINISGSPFQGPADAAVTMVIFNDFQ